MLQQYLRAIYNGFDTSRAVEPTMWREVLRVLNEATVSGLLQSSVPTHRDSFLAALRHSNEVFAAFKVHSMSERMAARLLNPDGTLKPFRQWADDVKSISSHYVGAWLRTEYDTALIRAHNAADWQQFIRDAGWRDDGLHPWKTTQRQREGGPDAKYTPLTSRRDHLMRSIQYSSQPGQVTVTNPVPYAAIHNNGGTLNTHPSVTKRMRRFAWAKVYALAGVKGKGKLPKQLPATAAKWRALALTKKSKLSITARIPQRQFMGDSRELKQKINTIINDSVKRIENGILNI